VVTKLQRVIVCSGHMIDAPGRKKPRFPASKEPLVRECITRQLDNWRIDGGDVALSGGARGADMLFAEECLKRNARVLLLVALPDAEFIERSVRLPGTDYEQRYLALRRRCETRFQQEELGPVSAGTDVFLRNNIWVIDTAQGMAEPEDIYAILVWDERPTGDGPGGTVDFAARIERGGGHAVVINPTRL
jgi:hypothetical protein